MCVKHTSIITRLRHEKAGMMSLNCTRCDFKNSGKVQAGDVHMHNTSAPYIEAVLLSS